MSIPAQREEFFKALAPEKLKLNSLKVEEGEVKPNQSIQPIASDVNSGIHTILPGPMQMEDEFEVVANNDEILDFGDDEAPTIPYINLDLLSLPTEHSKLDSGVNDYDDITAVVKNPSFLEETQDEFVSDGVLDETIDLFQDDIVRVLTTDLDDDEL